MEFLYILTQTAPRRHYRNGISLLE